MDTTIILLAGQYVKGDPSKPLHLCNLYGSKEAGAKLGEMLKMGSSKPWKEAMEVMTGQPEMSTDAMREYFLPLEKWLKKENKKNGVRVGWDHDDNSVMCSDQTSTTSQTGQNTRKIVKTHGNTYLYIHTVNTSISRRVTIVSRCYNCVMVSWCHNCVTRVSQWN